MNKLLPILALLFFSCDKDPVASTVHGCFDSTACNYNPNANIDNNSCIYVEDWDDDGDGVCDNVDDCIGVYDCSGECNGDAILNECIIGTWVFENQINNYSSSDCLDDQPEGYLGMDFQLLNEIIFYEDGTLNWGDELSNFIIWEIVDSDLYLHDGLFYWPIQITNNSLIITSSQSVVDEFQNQVCEITNQATFERR